MVQASRKGSYVVRSPWTTQVYFMVILFHQERLLDVVANNYTFELSCPRTLEPFESRTWEVEKVTAPPSI